MGHDFMFITLIAVAFTYEVHLSDRITVHLRQVHNTFVRRIITGLVLDLRMHRLHTIGTFPLEPLHWIRVTWMSYTRVKEKINICSLNTDQFTIWSWLGY